MLSHISIGAACDVAEVLYNVMIFANDSLMSYDLSKAACDSC